MTVVPFVGGFFRGTAAERAAYVTTNLRAGWIWIETDTRILYYWNGSTWTAISATLVGGTTINFNELTATNITEIKASDTSGLIVKGNTDVTSATARNIVFQTLNTTTDAFATALTINGTGPIISLGTTLDVNDKTLNNTPTIKGSDTTGVAIQGNTSASAATERTLILKTLNAATDTFVDALTITPNGASPTVTALNAILSNATITTPTIKYTDVTKVTGDSPYTIAAGDDIIRADASSGALICTLPTAVGITGKEYTIRRKDILASSVLVTVATTSSQTIAGAPAMYLWPGEFVVVRSDNANWEVISESNRGYVNYYMLKGTTPNRRYVAGAPNSASLATSTTSPAIDTLWAFAFPVPKVTKFDTISFAVTTTGVCNARCGIYRDSGNTYPGALIFDTGIIDCSTGTIKDTTITSGLQVFPPGLYWLAWECNAATIQIRALPGQAGEFGMLGSSSTMSANPGSFLGYSVAHTFGALPDPYTTAATVLFTNSAPSTPLPAIGLRAV